MTNIIAVIQARVGSTRLPNKMLTSLGTEKVLNWVIKRVLKAKLPSRTVLATTQNSNDDQLEQMATALGVDVIRGPVDDVLTRFTTVADKYEPEAIIRVCADNPFICPGEIDRLVSAFQQGGYDYLSNHMDFLDNGYADGFGAEIFTDNVLRELDQMAIKPRDREHITLPILEKRSKFNVAALPAPDRLAYKDLRFDIDTLEDLQKMRELVGRGITLETKAADIIRIAIGES